MRQHKSFKYRIYPNRDQQTMIAKTFGCKRLVYNHYLAEQQRRFANGEKHLSCYDIQKSLTQLKRDQQFAFLNEVDSKSLNKSVEDLATAYTNFFKSVKKVRHDKIERPKFKNKHSRQSYRTSGDYIRVSDDTIELPKLKSVRAVVHRELPPDSKIVSVTVSKNSDGRYYAAVLVETDIELQNMTGREIGIDLGLKDLVITSAGVKFADMNAMKNIVKTKRLLKKQQKKFSRTQKGSKNREKQRLRVARLYSRLTRQRNEYYHIISRYLVDNYDSIYTENLSVKNMKQNRKLSRRIHEVAWSTLTSMIAYKAAWAGVTVHKIDRFAASSKTCSHCGTVNHTLTLSDRVWQCDHCGSHHDRDINAATNIYQWGQRDLYDTTSHTRCEAAETPMTIQKFTTKIERSDDVYLLVKGDSNDHLS